MPVESTENEDLLSRGGFEFTPTGATPRKEGIGGDSPSQLIDARIKELSDSCTGETYKNVVKMTFAKLCTLNVPCTAPGSPA
jgi:hypothetical protein